MSQLLEVFGRLHPVVLHLPMGMLFGLGVFEFMAWRKGKEAAPRFWISLSACCAAFAAGSGLMLHQEPGYVEDSVMEFHERLGIATAVGAILCAMSYNHLSRYRKILALTVAAMLGAGHFGGTMTHGDGFLFKPLRPEPEKVIATVSYEQDIAPIFDAKCGKCHSARKQKGELRLDTPEWILKGGEEMGAAVNAGQPDGHAILERMLLDLQDEDHMPPEGKKQLTEPEMELVKEWLLLGAPFGKPLSAADPAALKTLKDNLIHVQTVSMDSNELYVDFAATAGEIDAQFVNGPHVHNM
ncbi:MAG: c-type cytochrome domain-containing protein [Planctomycetota bacterium]|nr:c-type cytochrome domain-containing protein [Planctomycetota bacterium]